jgi:hypothetical protein
MTEKTTENSDGPIPMTSAEGFDVWLENPYTKVLMKSTQEDYVPKWDLRVAFVSGADHALDLLVAAGHITRETAFQARDIVKDAADLMLQGKRPEPVTNLPGRTGQGPGAA